MSQPLQANSKNDLMVWLTVIGLSLCIFGLVHDTFYLTSTADNSVEGGEGIEQEEKFQQNVNAAPMGRKLGFFGMVMIGGLCCLQMPRGVKIYWGPLTFVLAAGLLWAAASYQWSADRHETGRELIRLFAYVFVGAALARRFDANELCFVVVATLIASVAIAVGLEMAVGNFRPWRMDYRIQGTLHTNVLARQAVLVAIAAVAYMVSPQSRGKWQLILIAAIAVAFLTKSRTGAVTLIAGLVSLRLMGSSLRSLITLGCASLALAGVGLMMSAFGGTWLQHQVSSAMTLGRNEDVTSLTGRLPLWNTILNESRDRRLIGFGYGAFWLPAKTEDIGSELNWFPRHAHSAYVELTVNLGLVGVSLAILTAVLGVLRASSVAVRTGLPEYRIIGAFLVAGLVNGVAEAAFVLPRDLGIFISAILFALVFVHPRVEQAVAASDEVTPTPLSAIYS